MLVSNAISANGDIDSPTWAFDSGLVLPMILWIILQRKGKSEGSWFYRFVTTGFYFLDFSGASKVYLGLMSLLNPAGDIYSR